MSFTIAATVDEALAALAAGARPIAGGTDLVVGARHGKAPLPEDLVAIDRRPEGYALLRNFTKFVQAEYLKSPRVGEYWTGPSHEVV